MRIHLIAVGQKMPRWVQDGYDDYARRLPAHCALNLIEIAAEHRGNKAPSAGDVRRILDAEGARQIAALPAGCEVVTLDVGGRALPTEQLAGRMERWLGGGRDVALLVGGPEGLAAACRERADWAWSLSPLTLPHPLVRVILAEQLYRASSILSGHPYHRA